MLKNNHRKGARQVARCKRPVDRFRPTVVHFPRDERERKRPPDARHAGAAGRMAARRENCLPEARCLPAAARARRFSLRPAARRQSGYLRRLAQEAGRPEGQPREAARERNWGFFVRNEGRYVGGAIGRANHPKRACSRGSGEATSRGHGPPRLPHGGAIPDDPGRTRLGACSAPLAWGGGVPPSSRAATGARQSDS